SGHGLVRALCQVGALAQPDLPVLLAHLLSFNAAGVDLPYDRPGVVRRGKILWDKNVFLHRDRRGLSEPDSPRGPLEHDGRPRLLDRGRVAQVGPPEGLLSRVTVADAVQAASALLVVLDGDAKERLAALERHLVDGAGPERGGALYHDDGEHADDHEERQ